MSDIHLNRAGQNLGVFTAAEVQAGLNSWKFLGTDLAWTAGQENWKPLTSWSEFTIPALPPPPAPSSVLGGPPALNLEKNLPSWEQKSEIGFFKAFGATAKQVLLEPAPTFSRMKETGGFLTPFLYLLLACGVAAFLTIGVQLMLGLLGSLRQMTENAEVSKALAGLGAGIGVGVLGMLILLPIFLFIGSFVGTAFWHVSLMILGGAHKSYEATYRVYCYAVGSSVLVSLVPCCGGLAALVWRIVAGSIGLSKVHEISTGKAVAAILLPAVVCCGFCGVGLFFGVQALEGNHEFMDFVNSLKNNGHNQ